jgi:hypothetical protein
MSDRFCRFYALMFGISLIIEMVISWIFGEAEQLKWSDESRFFVVLGSVVVASLLSYLWCKYVVPEEG